jgi:hypothetical protein
VEEAPQLLVSSWVVRAVHRPVVLVEKLLAFSFREVSEDHLYQRLPIPLKFCCLTEGF